MPPSNKVKPQSDAPSLPDLDRADKEMTQKLHQADRMLASAQMDSIQEHGIDSPDDMPNYHVNNVFLNNKVVQSPRHVTRRSLLAALFVLIFGYFILWALGIFMLPGLNI